MSIPDYSPDLTKRLIADKSRSWRTWQGFAVGEVAIDVISTLVVIIESVQYPRLQLQVRYPYGAVVSADPEDLVALQHSVRAEAYKYWCLATNQLQLFDAFIQMEAQMLESLSEAEPDGLLDQDSDHVNMLIDCGHVTSEPWRCPDCQELLCQLCRKVHKCTSL